MAGFLYFVSGFKNVPTAAELESLGLGHVGPVVSGVPCESGPGGERGITLAIPQSELAAGGVEPRVGYYKDTQAWRECAGYWIGYESQSPPTPADLVKRQPVHDGQGYLVLLGNGEKFIIPPERFIPDSLELDAEGCVTRVPLPAYESASGLAEKARADYIVELKALEGKEDFTPSMTEAEQIQLGNHFLGLVYRIGRDEANMLGLWTDDSVRAMLRAVLDVPAMLAIAEELDKKKDEVSSEGSGTAAS